MHPNISIRPGQRVAITLTITAATLSALAPLLLTDRPHIYGADPVNYAAAFVPLLGVVVWALHLLIGRRRPSWAMLCLVPHSLLAAANVLVWTRLVSFDPCYGSPDACADIGGGPAKLLAFFAVTILMPASALIGGLIFVTRDDG